MAASYPRPLSNDTRSQEHGVLISISSDFPERPSGVDISPGNAIPSDAKQCMLLPDDSRRSAVAVSGDSFDLLFWGKAGQPCSRSNEMDRIHRFCRMH